MKQKNSFSGQIGFVFAAAGSAVGVGNLWRFPYLAAKDGGGLFLIIYLVFKVKEDKKSIVFFCFADFIFPKLRPMDTCKKYLLVSHIAPHSNFFI